MGNWLPSWGALSRETIAVLFATFAAAYIISRFPKAREFVNDNSVTVKLPP